MQVPHAEASCLKMAAAEAAAAAATAPGSPGSPRTTGRCIGREPSECPLQLLITWTRLLGVASSERITRVSETKAEKMAKRRVAQRKPHFVKVLLGDFSQRLRIPPNFVKHFSADYFEKAILEGPTGDIWPVELQRTGKGTYLSRGWQNFVKDNALQGLELLLFRYEGRMHFNVSVFDTNACEREYTRRTCEGSAAYTEGLKRRCRPQKYPQLFGCHIQAEEERNKRTNSPNNDMHACYSNMVHCRCLQLPRLDVEIKVEEDELPLSAIGRFPSLCTFGSSRDAIGLGRRQPMTITCHRESQRSQGKKKIKGFLSQRRPVSLEERERAYEAAKSFTSDFPFFIECMKISSVYRVFLLRVPKSFAKAHLPRTRTELVLEDPTGRTWPVRYLPNIESKLSGGWIAFARGNHLEEGDLCVFELVRPVELRVHIFRVVEEIMPLIKASSM